MLWGEVRNLRGCAGGAGGSRPDSEAEERREMAEVGAVVLLGLSEVAVDAGRSSIKGRSSVSMMRIESRGSLVGSRSAGGYDAARRRHTHPPRHEATQPSVGTNPFLPMNG